jgi:zinc finger HIT domain-containing protein 1
MDHHTASTAPRRALRTRKVSERVAIVDDDERHRARKARLNALEDDSHVIDEADLDDPDDEEFVLDDSGDEEEDSDIGDGGESGAQKKRKRKKPAKKAKAGKGARASRHRGSLSSSAPSKLKTLQDWIEQDGLEDYPEYEPTYLTATVGKAQTRSARAFCSVCGQKSRYTCVRCGVRYCCMKCSVIHAETRCLKFTA